MGFKEADIQINGHLLGPGHAMTIRVCLSFFYTDLCEKGLGEDSHGINMKNAYVARIGEILRLMEVPEIEDER